MTLNFRIEVVLFVHRSTQAKAQIPIKREEARIKQNLGSKKDAKIASQKIIISSIYRSKKNVLQL